MTMFKSIWLTDPNVPAGRPSELGWWAKVQFDVMLQQTQEHLKKYPTTGSIADAARPLTGHYGDFHGKGVLATCRALYWAEGDDELQHRILTLASLHPAIGARKGSIPRYSPLFDDILSLMTSARAGIKLPWTDLHTDVVPRLESQKYPGELESKAPRFFESFMNLSVREKTPQSIRDFEVKLKHQVARIKNELQLVIVHFSPT